MNANQVEEFFNTPSNYLTKRYGLLIRSELLKLGLTDIDILKKDIVDIGCGDGSLVLPYLEKARSLTLIDIAQPMLDLARENLVASFDDINRKKVKYIKGDISELVLGRKFDLIIVIGVLAHVKDLEIFFSKILSILKPSGKLVIQFSTWYHPLILLSGALSKRSYPMKKLSKSQVLILLKQFGLEATFERQFSFPFPGMSYFSDSFLYSFQSVFFKIRFLSFFGADHFLVVRRSS